MSNYHGMYNKNFSKEPTHKQIVGKIGEDMTCEYLINRNYLILERNYYKKWGEIDIVANFNNMLIFVEVKTVTIGDVTYETIVNDNYIPEHNMHPWKLQRLSRVIQTYLIDKEVSDETDWRLDLVTVYLDKNKRLNKIEHMENIVL